MQWQPGPPSQGWRTFLLNHVDGIASIDLFVVPTISFRLLYGLLILRNDRRRILWLGVTAHPTAEWIAPAIVPAVLQRHPNTSVTGQGLTGPESRPCHREHSSVADPRRIASPLCPDLICDMDSRRARLVRLRDRHRSRLLTSKPRPMGRTPGAHRRGRQRVAVKPTMNSYSSKRCHRFCLIIRTPKSASSVW